MCPCLFFHPDPHFTVHSYRYDQERETYTHDFRWPFRQKYKLNELCNLLKSLDFVEHIRGSHHIFMKEDVIEKINLKKDGTKAKVYQVRQVRIILLKYKLGSR